MPAEDSTIPCPSCRRRQLSFSFDPPRLWQLHQFFSYQCLALSFWNRHRIVYFVTPKGHYTSLCPGEDLTSPLGVFPFLPYKQQEFAPVSLVLANVTSLLRRTTHRLWVCFTFLKHTRGPCIPISYSFPKQFNTYQASSFIHNLYLYYQFVPTI